MVSYLLSGLRRRDVGARGPNPRELLEGDTEPWEPLYIKGRILDAEESLHFQRLWLRIGRLWLFAVTPALIVAAAAAYFGHLQMDHSAYLYVTTGLSLALSPVVVYRQYKKMRVTRLDIRRLKLVHRRTLNEQEDASDDTNSSLLAQKRYREEALDVIEQLRENANKNSGVHNRLQGIIIIGSVSASAITTASVAFGEARWFAVGVTATMGLAAGFSGYYKFHERSFSSRQAADSIEREYEAVELRVGKYSGMGEEAAYALFAEVVERIRDEHDKRQQHLDQHMKVERDEPSR